MLVEVSSKSAICRIQKVTMKGWWCDRRVCDIPMNPMNTPLTITSGVTCKLAIHLLKEEGFNMVPIIEGTMTSKILAGTSRSDQS